MLLIVSNLLIQVKIFYRIEQHSKINLPLIGSQLIGVVVNLMPLGLIYSVLVVDVCDDKFDISCGCCSCVIVDDVSFLSISFDDGSSNEETIIGDVGSDDNLSVVLVSISLLFVSLSVDVKG